MSAESVQQRSSGIRCTALVVAFAFTVTSVAWNAPANAAPAVAESVFLPIEQLAIPAKIGTITRKQDGGWRMEDGEKPAYTSSALRHPSSDKFVVLIQDAHAVIDAQENIRNILGHLRKNYGVSLTALEGAKSRLEPILLKTFPEPGAKRKVLAGYENRAELSGPEVAAVLEVECAEYRGMEDWALYEQNYSAYLRAQENKKVLLARWNTFKERLDSERAKVYGPKLSEFHEARENFLAERDSLLDLLVYLSNFRERLQTSSGYQELPGLIDSIGYEKSGKSEALAPLVRGIADEFKTKYLRDLGVKSEMNFYKRYQAFMTGQITAGEMLQYLVAMGAEHGKAVRLSPALKKLLGHAELLSEIKGSLLDDEIQRFLSEVESGLIETPAQKEIADEYTRLYLFKDLIRLELTHEQLEVLKSWVTDGGWRMEENVKPAPSALLPSSFEGTNAFLSPEARVLLMPALDFYRLAGERDRAFYENIMNLMKPRTVTRDPRPATIAVVAGGFHTNGLGRLLKENGVPYAVVTPKISSLAGISNYSKVMRGDVSFKDHLKTTYFDGLMRHAVKTLAESLPIHERVRTLKVWRDNVIRELAKEGRVAEAGKFLPYLDELLRRYGEAATAGPDRTREEVLEIVRGELAKFKKDAFSKIWKTFEFQLGAFTEGLRQLIAKKDLNVKAVSDLLDRASPSKPSFLSPEKALEPGRRPVFMDVGPGLGEERRTRYTAQASKEPVFEQRKQGLDMGAEPLTGRPEARSQDRVETPERIFSEKSAVTRSAAVLAGIVAGVSRGIRRQALMLVALLGLFAFADVRGALPPQATVTKVPDSAIHYISTGEAIEVRESRIVREDRMGVFSSGKFTSGALQGGQCCFILAHPVGVNAPLGAAHFFPGRIDRGEWISRDELIEQIAVVKKRFAQAGITGGVFYAFRNGASQEPFSEIIEAEFSKDYASGDSVDFSTGYGVEVAVGSRPAGWDIKVFEGVLGGDTLRVGSITNGVLQWVPEKPQVPPNPYVGAVFLLLMGSIFPVIFLVSGKLRYGSFAWSSMLRAIKEDKAPEETDEIPRRSEVRAPHAPRVSVGAAATPDMGGVSAERTIRKLRDDKRQKRIDARGKEVTLARERGKVRSEARVASGVEEGKVLSAEDQALLGVKRLKYVRWVFPSSPEPQIFELNNSEVMQYARTVAGYIRDHAAEFSRIPDFRALQVGPASGTASLASLNALLKVPGIQTLLYDLVDIDTLAIENTRIQLENYFSEQDIRADFDEKPMVFTFRSGEKTVTLRLHAEDFLNFKGNENYDLVHFDAPVPSVYGDGEKAEDVATSMRTEVYHAIVTNMAGRIGNNGRMLLGGALYGDLSDADLSDEALPPNVRWNFPHLTPEEIASEDPVRVVFEILPVEAPRVYSENEIVQEAVEALKDTQFQFLTAFSPEPEIVTVGGVAVAVSTVYEPQNPDLAWSNPVLSYVFLNMGSITAALEALGPSERVDPAVEEAALSWLGVHEIAEVAGIKLEKGEPHQMGIAAETRYAGTLKEPVRRKVELVLKETFEKRGAVERTLGEKSPGTAPGGDRFSTQRGEGVRRSEMRGFLAAQLVLGTLSLVAGAAIVYVVAGIPEVRGWLQTEGNEVNSVGAPSVLTAYQLRSEVRNDGGSIAGLDQTALSDRQVLERAKSLSFFEVSEKMILNTEDRPWVDLLKLKEDEIYGALAEKLGMTDGKKLLLRSATRMSGTNKRVYALEVSPLDSPENKALFAVRFFTEDEEKALSEIEKMNGLAEMTPEVIRTWGHWKASELDGKVRFGSSGHGFSVVSIGEFREGRPLRRLFSGGITRVEPILNAFGRTLARIWAASLRKTAQGKLLGYYDTDYTRWDTNFGFKDQMGQIDFFLYDGGFLGYGDLDEVRDAVKYKAAVSPGLYAGFWERLRAIATGDGLVGPELKIRSRLQEQGLIQPLAELLSQRGQLIVAPEKRSEVNAIETVRAEMRETPDAGRDLEGERLESPARASVFWETAEPAAEWISRVIDQREKNPSPAGQAIIAILDASPINRLPLIKKLPQAVRRVFVQLLGADSPPSLRSGPVYDRLNDFGELTKVEGEAARGFLRAIQFAQLEGHPTLPSTYMGLSRRSANGELPVLFFRETREILPGMNLAHVLAVNVSHRSLAYVTELFFVNGIYAGYGMAIVNKSDLSDLEFQFHMFEKTSHQDISRKVPGLSRAVFNARLDLWQKLLPADVSARIFIDKDQYPNIEKPTFYENFGFGRVATKPDGTPDYAKGIAGILSSNRSETRERISDREEVMTRAVGANAGEYELPGQYAVSKNLEAFVASLKKFYPKRLSALNALDLATGTGSVAFAMASAGVGTITALDINEGMLERAQKVSASSSSVVFLRGDIFNAREVLQRAGRDTTFDLITIGYTLHAYQPEDLLELLSTARTMLSEGGRLVILGRTVDEIQNHRTTDDYWRILREAGFEAVTVEGGDQFTIWASTQSKRRSELRDEKGDLLIDASLVTLLAGEGDIAGIVMDILRKKPANVDAVQAELRRMGQTGFNAQGVTFDSIADVLMKDLEAMDLIALLRLTSSVEGLRPRLTGFSRFGDADALAGNIIAAIMLGGAEKVVDLAGFVDGKGQLDHGRIAQELDMMNAAIAALEAKVHEPRISIMMSHPGPAAESVLDSLQQLRLGRLVLLYKRGQSIGAAWRKAGQLMPVDYTGKQPGALASKIAKSRERELMVAYWPENIGVGGLGILQIMAEVQKIADPGLRALAMAAVRYSILRYATLSKDIQDKITARPELLKTYLDMSGALQSFRFGKEGLVLDVQNLADSFMARALIESAA